MSEELLKDDDYRGRMDWGLWRRMLAHARPYRRELTGLSVSGLIVAGIDVLFPLLTGMIIDEAIARGLTGRLWGYAAVYALTSAIFAAFIWWFIVLAGRVATGVAYDLRQASFARLQELSFSYYDVRPVGWLVSRLTSDANKLSNLLPWFMLDLAWGSAFILGIVAAMMWINWPLGLLVTAIVPPLILVSRFFQTRLLESSRLMRKTNSQMTASFNEAIMGVRTTKALVREEKNLEEFQALSGAMFGYSMRNSLQSAAYLPLIISIGSVGIGLALWRGGVKVGDGLTLGQLIAFMQYAGLFYMPIQELARHFTNLQAAQAAAERIQSLLDTEPEIRDSAEVLARVEAQALSAAPGKALDGGDERIETIEFEHVNFWYKEDEPVLQDFNLTVRAGQTVALVGATGGGKSTIVSLVARFYEPRSGRILINGVDARERSLHWLQSQLGVVLQTPHLFSGTVRENIRYGRLDASDEAVEAAARLTNAHEFIEGLDQGYETPVGEGGSRLSTGQRQLVALARAVLADPQIFIMDEATSSVDTETERLLQDAIENVLAGRIAFVIAHRLSTIRSADLILVIENGRIVEQGDHADLMRRRGKYYALYTKQFTREREERTLAGVGK